jgi:Zn-dependent metalloprotease
MCDNKASGICFILPPHILTQVSKNAPDPKVRDRALENLQLQSQLRGMRNAFAQLSFTGLETGTKRRAIHDCGHSQILPGKLVRGENEAETNDPAERQAYEGTGATYDFYLSVFNRNSIDDKGMRLISSVHFARDFDNAFWNGGQMVFGDGDGELFNPFTQCTDVIGHELTHGVTEFTAGLEYQDQSGALNEHISDVFGSLLKQFLRKQSAAQADWLIGEGLLAAGKPGSNRTALRSMKAPGTAYDDPVLGKDPQPGHMDQYDRSSRDHGGVHVNSGIPNHAFYLAATTIGGNAWEVPGHIWYEMLHRLRPNSQFADAAAAAREISQKHGKAAADAVDKAWSAVGL